MIIKYRPIGGGAEYVHTFAIDRPPGPAPTGRVGTVRQAAEKSARLALLCLLTGWADYVLTEVTFASGAERLAFLRHLANQHPPTRGVALDALRAMREKEEAGQ